jgi:hypothetical protein
MLTRAKKEQHVHSSCGSSRSRWSSSWHKSSSSSRAPAVLLLLLLLLQVL